MPGVRWIPKQGAGDVVGLLLDLRDGKNSLTFFLNGKLIPDGRDGNQMHSTRNVAQGELRGPLCWCTRVHQYVDEMSTGSQQWGVVRAVGKKGAADAKVTAAMLEAGDTAGFPFGSNV